MERQLRYRRIALGGLAMACATLAGHGMRGAETPPGARARLVFSHSLPRMDGSRLQAKLVEVTYGPGESSKPHSHPCPITGYVLEGAVRMRIGDSAERVYKAGEAFYEEAHSRHMVSANASGTERARFLAYFTCDRDAGPLSVPVHGDGR